MRCDRDAIETRRRPRGVTRMRARASERERRTYRGGVDGESHGGAHRRASLEALRRASAELHLESRNTRRMRSVHVMHARTHARIRERGFRNGRRWDARRGPTPSSSSSSSRDITRARTCTAKNIKLDTRDPRARPPRRRRRRRPRSIPAIDPRDRSPRPRPPRTRARIDSAPPTAVRDRRLRRARAYTNKAIKTRLDSNAYVPWRSPWRTWTW